MAKRIDGGRKEYFTFFFGRDNCFSQWYSAEFTLEGVKYNCAEQYMMHQKAVLFGDEDTAVQILESYDPKRQKALGRMVENFDPGVWEKECTRIVKEGNMAKFTQNPELQASLLSTEGTTLVEASPFDRIWGIGLGEKNPKAHHRSQWRGRNLLGNILTEVREEIKKKEKGKGATLTQEIRKEKEGAEIKKKEKGEGATLTQEIRKEEEGATLTQEIKEKEGATQTQEIRKEEGATLTQEIRKEEGATLTYARVVSSTL